MHGVKLQSFNLLYSAPAHGSNSSFWCSVRIFLFSDFWIFKFFVTFLFTNYLYLCIFSLFIYLTLKFVVFYIALFLFFIYSYCCFINSAGIYRFEFSKFLNLIMLITLHLSKKAVFCCLLDYRKYNQSHLQLENFCGLF